ncbi:MAG: hypothetical protein ACYTHJ_20840, partial [Planctomycetota bacterium]
MAVNVATLTAKIEADIKDFENGMKKADRRLDDLEKSTGKASKGISGFNKAAAAAAAAGLAALAGKTIMLASDAEEAGSAFRTVFGPAVDDAQRFVEDFANKAGFAEFELQQLMATTGNITQALGAGEEASAAMSAEMATLAGDVASFSNAAGGAPAVLAALQSALTGEREALKTYGIVISETEVQERALQETQKERAADLTR